MTNEQFERVRRLSLSLAGIALADRHRELLETRCRRLKIDPASLEALLSASEDGGPSARQQLIGLLTISHTGFFRTPLHFEIAAEHVLRVIERRGRARLWSAAAATGEEPYSLAMAVIQATGLEAPPVTILATDINPEVLEIARRGEYSEAAVSSLEPGLQSRFFIGPEASGRFRISEAVRRVVEFVQLNLSSEAWPVPGPFDVVFCRNVLMYLEGTHRYWILERLASKMAPDGLLVLDPAEHLGEAQHLFGAGSQGVYQRRSAPQGTGIS